MKRILTPLLVSVFLVSCEKDITIEPVINYELSIDSVLTQNGMRSLPKDSNGYYKLKFVSTGTPQSHRVTGRILANDKEPNPPQKIEFESNLYWWLRQGDTLATITKSYVNYFTGQFTIVQLPPMIASKDELVPTTNCCSYSGRNGEINTIIAPIKEMIGDTLVLKVSHYTSKKVVYAKVIIE